MYLERLDKFAALQKRTKQLQGAEEEALEAAGQQCYFCGVLWQREGRDTHQVANRFRHFRQVKAFTDKYKQLLVTEACPMLARLDALRERLQQATGAGAEDRLLVMTELDAEREKVLKELELMEERQAWDRLQPLQCVLDFASAASGKAEALLAPSPDVAEATLAATDRKSAKDGMAEETAEDMGSAPVDDESDEEDEDDLLNMMAARHKSKGRKRGWGVQK